MSHAAPATSPFLDERHARLAAEADAAGRPLEHEEDPRALVRALGTAGLLRHCVPSEYGGATSGIEMRALCSIRAALAYHSALADTMFAMQGLGSYPVTVAGGDAQRRALLPRVASGEAICAFALTEPEAGSDVGAIATTATRDPDSSDGDWILRGTKTFISNAGLATSYILFARTSPDRHRGLTAFLLDENASRALRVEPIELIAPHPIGTVHLDDLRLPDSARVGAEGGGFELAMATLDRFRASVGAAAVGMGARALDEAISRARTRRQFGKALSEFQATQLALAEMATDLDAARLLVERAAWSGDRGERPTRASAMAKLAATEAAQRIIDRALQLHGGAGVVRGAVVERLYREIRALRIYEGTSEIQKLVIARELLRSGAPAKSDSQ